MPDVQMLSVILPVTTSAFYIFGLSSPDIACRLCGLHQSLGVQCPAQALHIQGKMLHWLVAQRRRFLPRLFVA